MQPVLTLNSPIYLFTHFGVSLFQLTRNSWLPLKVSIFVDLAPAALVKFVVMLSMVMNTTTTVRLCQMFAWNAWNYLSARSIRIRDQLWHLFFIVAMHKWIKIKSKHSLCPLASKKTQFWSMLVSIPTTRFYQKVWFPI